MNITFNFKNFEPSDHLRDYARKRFEKLAKYTTATDASEVQVNLAVEKTRQMADVIFLADNMHISAHEVSEDMYSTIDMILDKVEAQAKKFREKQKDRRRQSVETVRMGLPVAVDYVEMPEALRAKYQYFTEARLDRLRTAGYDRSFASLEDGVADYVRDYLAGADPSL